MVVPLLAWLIGIAMFVALIGLIKFLMWLEECFGFSASLFVVGLAFSIVIAIAVAPVIRMALSGGP